MEMITKVLTANALLTAFAVVGIVMWFATIPAVLYVDKVGRKPILIVGAIGMLPNSLTLL